ncbi:MAG: hypothetical protein H6867_06850 [Rhodospirillales bacterium]|nr:hypothetical protein [Rhodospirillales bacterium]MCB9995268.1 hypothetical protein [Rhodospirillales bacterium]
MKQNQSIKHDAGLNTDVLAWRVLNAKRRETIIQRHKEYNERPRLRSDAHH